MLAVALLCLTLIGITAESAVAEQALLFPLNRAELESVQNSPNGNPQAGPETGAVAGQERAGLLQAVVRVPHGGAVTAQLARRAGEHAARLTGLEQVARRLSRKSGVRLMAGDIPRLMVIGGNTHSVDMLSQKSAIQTSDSANHADAMGAEPQGTLNPAPGEWRVVATLTPSQPVDAFLHSVTSSGESLETRGMAYAQLRRLNADVLRLARDAAILRQVGSDDSPQAERLVTLLTRMDELFDYLDGPFPPEASKLEGLLRKDPGNPVYLLDYAVALLRADAPGRALETLRALDAASAGTVQGLYLHGLALLALRLPALAALDFSRALQLAPDAPELWQARGQARAALRDYIRMCADLRRACATGLCKELENALSSELCL